MDEFLKLQEKGFYISLIFMPNGRYSIFISRWDNEDLPGQIGWFDSLEEIMEWLPKAIKNYEEGKGEQ